MIVSKLMQTMMLPLLLLFFRRIVVSMPWQRRSV